MQQIFTNTKVNNSIKFFLTISLSSALILSSFFTNNLTLTAIGDQFALCGNTCTSSTYYVGYNRSNQVSMNSISSTLTNSPDTVYLQSSDYKAIESQTNIDTQFIGNVGSDNVKSVHRLDDVKIGSIKKSETLEVNTLLPNSEATATVKLIWGDTLTVTSPSLPAGSPVSIQIKQNGGGFGDPVSLNAAYNGTMKTYINGVFNNNLFYQIIKLPGTNDYTESGNFASVSVISANVGDSIKIESKLEVTDQVFLGIENQILNGADSIDHKINMLTPGAGYTLASGSNLSDPISDTDGVPDLIEAASPNQGDANNDGVLDSLQSNVASLPDSVTSRYVAVAVDPTSPCQDLSNVSINTETQNSILDNSNDYSVGFVNFKSSCSTSLKVKIYWYGLDTTKNYTNRKFNKSTNTYSDVSGITSTIENINGTPVLTYSYSIDDNGPIDSDLLVGSIEDPIGPVLITPSSNAGGTITITNPTSSTSSIISSSSSSLVSTLSSNSLVSDMNKTNISTGILNINLNSDLELNEILEDNLALPRTGGIPLPSIISLLILIIFTLTGVLDFLFKKID